MLSSWDRRSSGLRGARRRTLGVLLAVMVAALLAGGAPASAAPAPAPAPAQAPAPAPAPTGPEPTHPDDDHMGSTIRSHEPSTLSTTTPRSTFAAGQVPGMDVSRYQGNVDWRTAYANGARFAYVKASESTTYVNPYFSQQYNGSYGAGMVRGAYHFADPNTSSGAAQATYFVNHGGGWTADGRTLPPMLDIEYNPYGSNICYGLSTTAMSQWIADFSNTVHAMTGRFPTIYTTTNWWNTCTGSNRNFGANPLFIARYNTTPGTLPPSWSNYTLWQYSDSGVFPGDQDVFNGNAAQLTAFAGPAPAPAPTPTPAPDPVLGPAAPARYTPVTPARLADTRPGSGQTGAGQTLGQGGQLTVQVTGKGGVPTTGVTSAVVNVTVANSTKPTYLTVYPAGQARPVASSLNDLDGSIVSNQVSARLSASGALTVYNNTGTADVIVDVEGYYASGGSALSPITPVRVADTRAGSGKPNAGQTLAPSGTLNVAVAGAGNAAPAGATAAVVEVTVTNPTAGGFLTVSPAGRPRPVTSNLNHVAGQNLTKEITVGLGTNPAGALSIFNGSSGTTDVAVDVVGYYTTAGTGTFRTLTPARLADTRAGSGQGYAGQTIRAGQTLKIQASGKGGVAATGASAVVLNVTAPAPDAAGFLTVFPDGATRPGTSNISLVPGQLAVNEVTVKLGPDGSFDIYNNAGNTDVVVDVAGYDTTS